MTALGIAETNVRNTLAVARFSLRNGDRKRAYRLYQGALVLAQEHSGRTGALTGYVLLDLFEFYKTTNDEANAAATWKHLQEVAAAHYLSVYPTADDTDAN